MSDNTVSAKVTLEDDSEVTDSVEYDFGANLDEAVEKFGAEVIFKRFRAQAVVDLQGIMRRHMSGKEPKRGKALQEAVNEWKPGVQKARKSRSEKALELLGGMTPEERAEFLSSLDDD